MTTYIVSRHDATTQWILNNLPHGTTTAVHMKHFELQQVQKGDIVIGVLPIHIIAQITAIGAIFYSFEINTPFHLRGVELTLQQVENLSPKLVQYTAQKV